ncbi:chemotaxis protein methyltransferase CheR [Brevinema andersonii]|uniref:protein-glutamate O-methyltransferase n=1 Tax=Brevinema andersonii TaxID=34097 RepID=A0A1I1CYH6_BREAD|nr:protein-glutamate O-methyltransferase CheR [Brevinema andersonii]SFB67096.1 chemotaxis protein methyltransferase CheR [Brevinema andersonii]
MSLHELTSSTKVLETLAAMIHQESGIIFTPSHMKVLDQRVQSTLKEKKCSDIELLELLKNNKNELHAFIGHVTTNHTQFFRSIGQYELLGTMILPELVQKNKLTKTIKLWSAASSSGEEAYTCAMYIQYYFDTHGLSDWYLEIFATDIDQTSIKLGENAEYPFDALRHVPQEYHQYLDIDSGRLDEFGFVEGAKFSIKPAIRNLVSFQEHNLLDSAPYRDIDIIFCRNVLIYFDEKTQHKVVSHLEKALASKGYFFVSPSETLNGITGNLEIKIFPKGIYYIKKD